MVKDGSALGLVPVGTWFASEVGACLLVSKPVFTGTSPDGEPSVRAWSASDVGGVTDRLLDGPPRVVYIDPFHNIAL